MPNFSLKAEMAGLQARFPDARVVRGIYYDPADQKPTISLSLVGGQYMDEDMSSPVGPNVRDLVVKVSDPNAVAQGEEHFYNTYYNAVKTVLEGHQWDLLGYHLVPDQENQVQYSLGMQFNTAS